MLIELFGRNFRCMRDEFRLSMVAAGIDAGSDRGIVDVPLTGEAHPLRLLRCATIYGPNASGKSTILIAAYALQYLIATSAKATSDEPIRPYVPFLLDVTSGAQPVMLGLRAVVDGRAYEYKIEFDRTRFLHESLAELNPEEDHVLFERTGQEVSGPWTSDEQFGLMTRAFRSNALLLSLADNLAPNLAQNLAVGFRKLLNYLDQPAVPDLGPSGTALLAKEDPSGFGTWLTLWLKSADIGVVGYEVDEENPNDGEEADDASQAHPKEHAPEYRLSLIHGGTIGPTRLRYRTESLGTRKLASLAPLVHHLTSATEPHTYFVDELGASLHPQLMEELIRQFNCDVAPEDVRGQLIFPAHETVILDREAKDAVLRRDQVYFTEKDADGSCRLYSLAEFKERNNLNLRKRYLEGRYGALPALGSLGD